MKKIIIINSSECTSNEDPESLEFDPSTLFSSLTKKDNDIRVDGNKIYFYKSVSKETVLNLLITIKQTIKKMKEVNNEYSVEEIPIYLFINSEGGDYFAGISAHDQIKNLDYPIYTVIDGMVASAGTFLSLAGRKRYINKHAWVLIHQIKTWFGGMYTYEQLKDEMQNCDNIMKSLNQMYLENTKIKQKKLDTFFKHDLYINAEDCIKLGIAESVYSDLKRKN
jgi:ATP-dependent protease ClpP protease subunit